MSDDVGRKTVFTSTNPRLGGYVRLKCALVAAKLPQVRIRLVFVPADDLTKKSGCNEEGLFEHLERRGLG
jgi:hypothetical protein